MAKRFTDTAKWDKAWFRKLAPEFKCIWMFLCDRCDHAGVWDIDEDAFEYFIGQPISIDLVAKTFGDKIEIAGEKIIVKAFNDFQYGALNPENRVHKSVLDRLQKVKNKGLGMTLKGSKDTDTDKDKDTDTDKGESEGKNPDDLAAEVYAAYPRKMGKRDGIKALVRRFNAGLAGEDALNALERFKAHHKTAGTGKEYLPYFSTWVNDLDDWLESDAGHAEDFSQTSESIDDLDLSRAFNRPGGAA